MTFKRISLPSGSLRFMLWGFTPAMQKKIAKGHPERYTDANIALVKSALCYFQENELTKLSNDERETFFTQIKEGVWRLNPEAFFAPLIALSSNLVTIIEKCRTKHISAAQIIISYGNNDDFENKLLWLTQTTNQQLIHDLHLDGSAIGFILQASGWLDKTTWLASNQQLVKDLHLDGQAIGLILQASDWQLKTSWISENKDFLEQLDIYKTALAIIFNHNNWYAILNRLKNCPNEFIGVTCKQLEKLLENPAFQ